MNELIEIKAKVEKILEGVNNLLQWKSGLDEMCKGHREKTDGMHETLYHNPGGLVYRVQSLENCKKKITDVRAWWLTVLQKIVTWGIIGLIAWLLMMYGQWSAQNNRKSGPQRGRTNVHARR